MMARERWKIAPTREDWEWLGEQLGGFHIATTLLSSGTKEHLLTEHEIVPTRETSAANLRAHLLAHRGNRAD
jgi:hypothetical protein